MSILNTVIGLVKDKKAAKRTLMGKYVLLIAEILRPEFRTIEGRLILLGAGSLKPETYIDKDNVCAMTVADGHIQCWNWIDIERLATDEEVIACKKAKAKA